MLRLSGLVGDGDDLGIPSKVPAAARPGVRARSRPAAPAPVGELARDAVDDPALALVLDEIDLRVAVELAKLDSGL